MRALTLALALTIAMLVSLGIAGAPSAAAVTLVDCYENPAIMAADTGLQPGDVDRAITAGTTDDTLPAPMAAAIEPPNSITSRAEYGTYFTTAPLVWPANLATMLGKHKEILAGDAYAGGF